MTRIFSSDWRDHCRSDRPDPYPVHILKRVDRPTSVIHDEQVQRFDPRENGFNRAGRGDFGPFLAREYLRFQERESGARIGMVSTGPDRNQTMVLPEFAAALDSIHK